MAEEESKDDVFEEIVDEMNEEPAGKVDVEISDAAAGSLNDLQDLRDQLSDAEGRVLRAQAELENFRIRVRRETENQLKFANQPLLSDMLPVIDNVYRAVSAASQNESGGGLLEGVLMVAQQLIDTLEKHHCKRIDAVGELFDPNVHEAIQQMPSDEHEAGLVAQVVQEGYTLHDRVVRPSHVIISTGPASE